MLIDYDWLRGCILALVIRFAIRIQAKSGLRKQVAKPASNYIRIGRPIRMSVCSGFVVIWSDAQPCKADLGRLKPKVMTAFWISPVSTK